MEATLDRPEVDMNKPGAEPPALPVSTFEERLQAVEKMKANLVAEGKTRLEQIVAERKRLDAEEAHLRDFLGLDKVAPAPEPEKRPKAARGSVRNPVLAFYQARIGSHNTASVAKETGLDLDQVQGAAAKLAKDGHLVRVEGQKSTYIWKGEAA